MVRTSRAVPFCLVRYERKSTRYVYELCKQCGLCSLAAVVAPEWLTCFPASDRAALFDAFLEQAPSVVLLQALVLCEPLHGCRSALYLQLS